MYLWQTYLSDLTGTSSVISGLPALRAALKDTAAAAEEEQKRPKSARVRMEKNQKDWDAFLLSQLSPLTATWMVHECTPDSG